MAVVLLHLVGLRFLERLRVDEVGPDNLDLLLERFDQIFKDVLVGEDFDFLLVEVVLDLEVWVSIVILDHTEVELCEFAFA